MARLVVAPNAAGTLALSIGVIEAIEFPLHSSTDLSHLSAASFFAACPAALKVKLVDVLFREEERFAEQDVVALDFHVARAFGFKTGGAGLEFAAH